MKTYTVKCDCGAYMFFSNIGVYQRCKCKRWIQIAKTKGNLKTCIIKPCEEVSSLDCKIAVNRSIISISHKAMKYHNREEDIDRELDIILDCLDEISEAIDKVLTYNLPGVVRNGSGYPHA